VADGEDWVPAWAAEYFLKDYEGCSLPWANPAVRRLIRDAPTHAGISSALDEAVTQLIDPQKSQTVQRDV
jgi:hypothetical protein